MKIVTAIKKLAYMAYSLPRMWHLSKRMAIWGWAKGDTATMLQDPLFRDEWAEIIDKAPSWKDEQ